MLRLFWLAVIALVSLPSFSQSVNFNMIKLGKESGPVTGDFNGDGREDMLYVVPTNFNTFRMLISTGTGTYSPSTTYPIPTGRSAGFVAGDFNNDGKLDLVLLTPNPAAIYFYRGNGNGTFQAPVKSSAAFFAPSGIVAADVNHDGKMDLVININNSDNSTTLQTYFGNGNGTFTAGPTTQSPSTMFGLISGDFDGDGKVDLFSANCTGPNCAMTIYYGDGTGRFGSTATATTGQSGFTVADVDGDGKSDIITGTSIFEGGSSSTDQPYLSVFYGSASRTLNATQIATTQCAFNNAPVVADFNGDHIPDIIFFQHTCNSSSGSAEVTFLLGKGSRTFGVEQTVFNSTYVQVPGRYAATVRANNSDSKPDFFFNQFENTGGGSAQQMYAMVNSSSGAFAGCNAPNSATGFRICTPASGSAVSSPVKFSIGAAGEVPMRKVEVWVDGVKKSQSLYAFSHYAFLDASVALAKGKHAVTIVSVGWDNSLQSKKYSITVK